MSYRYISSYPSSRAGEGVGEGGTVVRALVTHQSSLGSKPSVDARCGLSLLLVLSFAPRSFRRAPGTPFPPFPVSLLKNQQFRRGIIDEELCACATCKSLFIYLFIYALINLFTFL